MKKILSFVLCFSMVLTLLAACTPEDTHEHTFDTQLSWDSESHWYAATCEHTDEVSGKQAHIDEDNNDLCDVCSYAMNHTHSFEKAWTYDDHNHWHKSTCGHQVKDAEAAHADGNNDGSCDVCGYVASTMYQVEILDLPAYVQLLDASGKPAAAPFQVKEGQSLTFQLSIPAYASFEGVPGATVSEPVKDGSNLVYTVTLTVTADTKLSPVVSVMSAFEVIVAEGSNTIETEGYHEGSVNILFTAPSAGRYAIYATNDDQVQFGAADGTDHAKVYLFDVAEAGEVAVRARCYGIATGVNQNAFTYTIIKLEQELTLPSLEGSGYLLPTVVPVDLYVTLPKAGLYQVSTSWDTLAWNDDLSKPYFITATEDNQTVKLQARFDIFNYPVNVREFVLDWKIQLIAPETELKLGESKLTVPYGGQYGFSFTADKAGRYTFTSSVEYVRFNLISEYNRFAPQGTTYTVDLKQGDMIELYLDINVYAMPDTAPRADTETTVHISFQENEVNHEHSFASAWTYDETGHWYAAICSHSNEKKDFAVHSFDAKGICACGYEHAHSYDAWSYDEQNHWLETTCGHDANKDLAKHDYDAKGICKVCKAEHKHSYADDWTSDDSNHWKELSCGHDADKGQLGAHVDTDKDGKCDTCARVVTHYHSFDTSKWISDDNYHWHAATCGHDVVDAKATHDYDAKGICKVCKTEHKHTYSEKWSQDASNHWHAPTCGHEVANQDSAKHSYDAKGICACGYEHVHTYATTWSQDEAGHWYAVSCGHQVTVEKLSHTYDAKGICTVCKYEHKHTYAATWSSDADNHYHAPTCGHETANKDVAKHTLNDKGVCTTCGFEHDHTYEENFTKLDNEYHGRLPVCGHNVDAFEKAKHEDLSNDGVCDACGWNFDHDHSYANTYTSDEEGHWRVPTCGHNVGITDVGSHADADVDGFCDVCSYEVGIPDKLRDWLNGEFDVVYSGLNIYNLSFKFNSKSSNEGVLIFIDDFGMYSHGGEYTFIYDPATATTQGLKIMKDGIEYTAFKIKANTNGEWLFTDRTVKNSVMRRLRPAMDKVWETSVIVKVTDGYCPTEKFTFIAPFTGSFVLKTGAGTTNVSVYNYKYQGIDVPYDMSLEKGDQVTFYIATNATRAGEYNLNMVVMGVEGEYIPPENMLLVGEDKQIIVTHNTTGGEEVVFKAREEGTYKITFVNDDFGCFNKYNVFPLTAYGDGNSIMIALEAGEMIDFLVGVDDPVNSAKYGTITNPYTLTIHVERIGDYDETYKPAEVEEWTEEDFEIPRAIVKGKKNEE